MLLAVCLTVGLVAEALRFPKVTAYLGVGILFGPSVFDLVPHRQVLQLTPLLKLAMGLVLFQLGSQFPLPRLKALVRRLTALSSCELGLTFLLVTGGVWALTSSPVIALLLGALALETAPATTLLVLRETESEGPVTELSSALVAASNFASIVIFEAIFLAVVLLGGDFDRSNWNPWIDLLRDIGGSLALGAGVGLGISFVCSFLKPSRWLVLLVAANAIVLGLCESLQIPYMLAFLAMGLIVVNASDRNREIQEELKHLTGLLTVTFFVVHGAELDLASLSQVGLIGVVYVIARCLGKYVGIRAAAKGLGESVNTQRWLGATLFSHAGAAIALTTVAVERAPEIGKQLQTIILGTVVVFELIGPIMIRHAIRKSGEMPIDQAIHHTSVTPWHQLRDVWARLAGAMRRRTNGREQESDLTVRDLMRAHVPPIRDSATFDEVLDFVEHSHDDTYPVVDEQGGLIGVIRYRELSHALFDPLAGSLICAADLTQDAEFVFHPDDTLAGVREAFRRSQDDCIPVVKSKTEQEFTGIVRRRDFMRLSTRQRGD